jgi:hypothetical protein
VHKFEASLNDLAAKSVSNQELIQSIDKELGKQLKELAAKSDLELLKSGMKSFFYDMNQKLEQSQESLGKFEEQAPML